MVKETTLNMTKNCAVAIAEVIKAAKDTHQWAPHEVVHGIKTGCALVCREELRSVLAGSLKIQGASDGINSSFFCAIANCYFSHWAFAEALEKCSLILSLYPCGVSRVPRRLE